MSILINTQIDNQNNINSLMSYFLLEIRFCEIIQILNTIMNNILFSKKKMKLHQTLYTYIFSYSLNIQF